MLNIKIDSLIFEACKNEIIIKNYESLSDISRTDTLTTEEMKEALGNKDIQIQFYQEELKSGLGLLNIVADFDKLKL